MLYKMQNLPKCTNPISKPLFIETEIYTKVELINQIRELISTDCWACVLDGEILWNNYGLSNYNLTFKQKIYESMIRDYLIENTQLLIHESKTHQHVLDIYMFTTQILLIKITIKNGEYRLNYFN
jgi:hypothetical protein